MGLHVQPSITPIYLSLMIYRWEQWKAIHAGPCLPQPRSNSLPQLWSNVGGKKNKIYVYTCCHFQKIVLAPEIFPPTELRCVGAPQHHCNYVTAMNFPFVHWSQVILLFITSLCLHYQAHFLFWVKKNIKICLFFYSNQVTLTPGSNNDNYYYFMPLTMYLSYQ